MSSAWLGVNRPVAALANIVGNTNVSNTSLSEEMARTAAALRLTAGELAAIAVNAFHRAFGPRTALDPMERAAEKAWSAWAAEAPPIS